MADDKLYIVVGDRGYYTGSDWSTNKEDSVEYAKDRAMEIAKKFDAGIAQAKNENNVGNFGRIDYTPNPDFHISGKSRIGEKPTEDEKEETENLEDVAEKDESTSPMHNINTEDKEEIREGFNSSFPNSQNSDVVFIDLSEHGVSERFDGPEIHTIIPESWTIDNLGDKLLRVIDGLLPEGSQVSHDNDLTIDVGLSIEGSKSLDIYHYDYEKSKDMVKLMNKKPAIEKKRVKKEDINIQIIADKFLGNEIEGPDDILSYGEIPYSVVMADNPFIDDFDTCNDVEEPVEQIELPFIPAESAPAFPESAPPDASNEIIIERWVFSHKEIVNPGNVSRSDVFYVIDEDTETAIHRNGCNVESGENKQIGVSSMIVSEDGMKFGSEWQYVETNKEGKFLGFTSKPKQVSEKVKLGIRGYR